MIQAEQVRTSEPAARRAPAIAPSESAAAPRRRAWVGLLSVKRLSAVYLWVLFIVLFGVITPDTFLTETTFRLVFRSGVITCVLALAFLVPLTAGAYDLSVGAVMSLALGLMVYMSIHTGIPVGVAALIVVAASAACGAASGFIIVRLHVNSFIATLGVSQLLLGAVLLLSNNTQLVGELPQSWSDLGNNDLLGIPIVVYFLLALSLVLWYVLEFTRVGRYMFATAATRMPRAWPASRPTASSGPSSSRAARSQGWRASSSRCRAACTRRASGRVTCSPPWPPCSSAPRSSRGARTSGAR